MLSIASPQHLGKSKKGKKTEKAWKSPEHLFCALMHIKEFESMKLNKVAFQFARGQQEKRPKPEQRNLGVSKTGKRFKVELYFLTTYVLNKVNIFDCNLYSIHLKVNN